MENEFMFTEGRGTGGIVGVFEMDMYSLSTDKGLVYSTGPKKKKKLEKSTLMRDPELDTPS